MDEFLERMSEVFESKGERLFVEGCRTKKRLMPGKRKGIFDMMGKKDVRRRS